MPDLPMRETDLESCLPVVQVYDSPEVLSIKGESCRRQGRREDKQTATGRQEPHGVDVERGALLKRSSLAQIDKVQ